MRISLPVILFFLLSLPSRAQDPSVPKELQPFVPDGFLVLDFRKGDINYDKRPDYVVVLRKQGEDSLFAGMEVGEAPPRPLLLIVRKANGRLVKATENNELVLCGQCGGVMGDPYQGIEWVPGGFTIDFYGGSSWRWGDQYTFKYDRLLKDWMLALHRSTSFHAGDPENTTREAVIRRSEAGNLSLKNFTPYYNLDSSSWQVKAPRAYFYNSPEPGTQPRKAYLVKGDQVVSTRRFRNFVYVAFTNSQGEVSYGYLLKKDLQLLSEHIPATH